MVPFNHAQFKADLASVIPDGWRGRVTTRQNGWVVLTICSAPVDLMAVEAVAHPDSAGATFVKVNPFPYERPWCEASASIGAIWKVLCRAKFRELWIGRPGTPFVVRSK
jgi:hypothetical protein